MKILLAGFACLTICGLAGAAQANLLTNGSFEDTNGSYQNGAPYITVDGSGVQIPGWTVSAGSVDWIDSYWNSSNGSKSIDLAGYYAHGLIESSSFATTAGQRYRVQFDIAGNPDQAYSKALVAVSSGDSSGNLYLFSFDQAGHDKTNMGWQTETFYFTADASGSAALSFGDITGQLTADGWDPTLNPNEAWGAAIDNVTVDPVPEPSTCLLLGAGVAGLGLLRRKRRGIYR